MKNIKKLKEKIKTDKKFKKQFIACVSAAAVIVVCAVAVPVGVHSSNVKKAETAAEEASIAAELTTDEEATAEETTEALTEEAATVEETTADVTVASADTVKSTTKSSTTKANTTKANTTKAGTTKAAATAAAATVAETTTQRLLTRADIEGLIPGWKAYVESLGCVWDETLTTENSCWGTCAMYTPESTVDCLSTIDKNIREHILLYTDPTFCNPPATRFNIAFCEGNDYSSVDVLYM